MGQTLGYKCGCNINQFYVNGFDRGEIVQEITILAINGESCKWSLNKSGRGIGNLKPSGMMRPLHSTLRHWEWVNSSSPDDSRLFSASANYTPPIFASTNPVFPSSSFAAPSSSPRFPRSETGTKTRKTHKRYWDDHMKPGSWAGNT